MHNIGLTKRDVARELARRYSTMTHDELDVLENILVPMKFAKGEKVLCEKETCRHIYWIVKGLVRQFYHKNGQELTEYMAVENYIVMSIESLFKEEPTRMQIVALEPTVIYALPKLQLEQLHADMLRFETARDRYIKFAKHHPQLVLRAPLVHIASYLQMTPETLSRIRKALLMEER